MAAFEPIDPEGKSERELLLAAIAGVHATHTCLDTFKSEQEARDAEATRRRNEMSRDVRALKGDVKALKGDVADVKTAQDIDGGRITKLAQLFGAERVEKGQEHPKGKGFATWGFWKVAGAGCGMISGAAVFYKIMVLISPAVWAAVVGVALSLHAALLAVAK